MKKLILCVGLISISQSALATGDKKDEIAFCYGAVIGATLSATKESGTNTNPAVIALGFTERLLVKSKQYVDINGIHQQSFLNGGKLADDTSISQADKKQVYRYCNDLLKSIGALDL